MHLGSDPAGPSFPLNLKMNIRKGQGVKSISGRTMVKILHVKAAVVRPSDSSLV